ncbi:MAG TPA: hypothetical protein VE984_07230 [Gaiellaceae bacterium]|nr:hypothetical protein [Gaiellaceae bacterium]
MRAAEEAPEEEAVAGATAVAATAAAVTGAAVVTPEAWAAAGRKGGAPASSEGAGWRGRRA